MPTSYSLIPGGSDVDSTRGFTNLTILDQPEVPCAVVKADAIAMDTLPKLFAHVRAVLPTTLTQAGYTIVAPAIAVYFRLSGVDAEHATADAAVGFPIDAPLTAPLPLHTVTWGKERLAATPWAIPGGRIAVLSHHGTYSTLQHTWGEVITTMTERGLSPVPPFWEVYTETPVSDASSLPQAPVSGPDAILPAERIDLFVSLASRH